jgi:glycosyl transferase family 25
MKIFVISLEGHERRKSIQQQFDALGIPFDFVDAVYGASMTAKQKSYIDFKKTAKFVPRGMGDAEFGCALSHGLLYKKIADDGIEHAIILEDDVRLTEDFKALIDNQVLEYDKSDLMLFTHNNAHYLRWSQKPLFLHYKSHGVLNTPFLTAAYYVNLKAAQHLCSVTLPIYSTADWPIGAFKGICVRALYPLLIARPDEQENISTIGDKRHVDQQAFVKRQKQRPFYILLRGKIVGLFFRPLRRNDRLPRFWMWLFGFKLPDNT